MRTILNSGGAGVLGALVLTLAACGSSSGRDSAVGATGTCPTAPVPIVVTVDQWGDIVNRLAGACGRVTTIFKSSSADPHEYEPTPADAAAFADAALVVMNGLDYDTWADKAVDALDRRPAVVNAGDVVGLRNGDNPHVWYGPDYVFDVAHAVTAALARIAPRDAPSFELNNKAWIASMRTYRTEIERLEPAVAGKGYGATEGVFDYMAAALGMRDATPSGYRRAAENETEPGPADLHEFEQGIERGAMSVLIVNAQTQGAIPDLLRSHAEDEHVPVVEVTESVPPSADSFAGWQVSQLRDLAKEIGL